MSGSSVLLNTLGRNERLRSRKLIEELFRRGKTFTLFPLRILYLASSAESDAADENAAGNQKPHTGSQATIASANEQAILQAGFSVSSRNFKKATDRNRIKRLLRECYRTQKHPLAALTAEKKIKLFLFIIYTGKEMPGYALIKEKTNQAIEMLMKKMNHHSAK